MTRVPLFAALLLAGLQQPTPAPNDYGNPAAWLCRPGRSDACAIDNSATIVAADGSFSRESWRADAGAPIDCFYVYPTVSTDSTPNSDMIPDPPEIGVIRQQFARFGSVCRPYAPLYRQMTLGTVFRRVRGDTAGLGVGPLQALAYRDVRDAWQYYLEHDNKGRGVVLIGHSQGAYLLADLIAREIDGKPVQQRLVSAILAGATIAVPRDREVGGKFQQIPLCRTETQTGCVITFVSFRATSPPPAGAFFGAVRDPGMVAACTNPAALAGGEGALHSYFDVEGIKLARSAPRPWVTPERPIPTPFVSVPGLLTAKCASNQNASGYLEVTVHGNPADPRTDDISGDITPEWGLHLLDVPLTMGNLVELVGRQAAAYARRTHP